MAQSHIFMTLVEEALATGRGRLDISYVEYSGPISAGADGAEGQKRRKKEGKEGNMERKERGFKETAITVENSAAAWTSAGCMTRT